MNLFYNLYGSYTGVFDSSEGRIHIYTKTSTIVYFVHYSFSLDSMEKGFVTELGSRIPHHKYWPLVFVIQLRVYVYNVSLWFLAHDRMSVASLCNPDLSVVVVVVVVIVVVVVVCEHSSWPHAWSNKVHTLHAHAAISCIVAHQKLYHSDLYLLYSSHICMFILMSIVHEVINIATSNLTETCI